MKKDIREIIYRLYEESLKEEPFEEFRGEEEPIIGGVYLGLLNKKRVMFVIIDKITDKYFEVLKISHFWELGTIRDIVYRNEIGTFIIETDLNFYLKDDEIKRFKKIDIIDNVEKIKEYRELSTEEKLKSNIERGLFYIYENVWVEKFKEKELEVIKPYHLRIFNIIDELEKEEYNIIPLSPEREENYRYTAVASTEKNTALGENFVIYREPQYINIIVSQEFINKKVSVFLEGEKIFENVLDDTVITLKFENPKNIDLEKLAKSIKVVVEE
ncbi:hypothetical protein SULAZ_1046 [Sulfurihydrogenibium azorense Az-Fu1]|uniref:Uncharacterized protein n=1 Tax=Sulfurihydrogenibium azorense (strain DSM 15241 / OCM 825 / Az-Fu1) TaxID=204536 RepID=C1DV82_SULAA|nr:hypothetical protein [Sulfurihydrogenibium azorense]ACN99192.1 hypothetical protein SULAZ_1046 [Sulfurihydrogenibium azorense Az-Fu1]